MPAQDGTLSAEEVADVLKWLGDHWKDRACPICAQDSWLVDKSIGRVDVMASVGGPYWPLVVVMCKVCGNTIFFNAAMAGVQRPEGTQLAAGPGDAVRIAEIRKPGDA